jgi:hypothetical protein
MIDTAKQHIINVIQYVLSQETDGQLSDVLTVLNGYPSYRLNYSKRNIRDGVWGKVVGSLLVGDTVQISEQKYGWGKIAYSDNWIYMGSMVRQ